MSGPLRVAVIGAGFGQQVHVPAFRADSRCEVTTLCASTQAKAADVAGRLGVPRASGDWRTVVSDPEIDAVSIAVPPRLQPQIAMESLKQGKAVFCEKPLAAHVYDALPIRKFLPPFGLRPLMVNFEFCECDAWHDFQKYAPSHWIGRQTSVQIKWRVRTYSNKCRLENWKSRPEEGGGALQGFVAHTFYLLERLCGPISRLRAQLTKAPDDGRTGETDVHLEVQFFFGGHATVHVATDAPPPHCHQIDLVSPYGALRLLNEGSDYIDGFQLISAPSLAQMPRVPSHFAVSEANRSSAAAGVAAPQDGRVQATSRLVRKFVDWTLGGSPAHPDFADGYRVQFLIDAARRSNAEGRWMDTIE